MSYNNKTAHRGHTVAAFREMVSSHPGMTLGEIIFAIVNPTVVEGKFSDILNIEDKEMYKMIAKANEREKE